MSRNRFALALILALAACIGTAHAGAKQHPTLPRKSSDARVAVAIYEFTSNLPEISPRGATEQFKTALVPANLGLLCLAHHALRITHCADRLRHHRHPSLRGCLQK